MYFVLSHSPSVWLVAPTSSPSGGLPPEGGGACPEVYNSTATYESGDEVSLNGVAYRCLPSVAAYCNAYSPDSATGFLGWETIGPCAGVGTLPVGTDDIQSCPPEFDTSTAYVDGDVVSFNALVYECKPWPESLACSSAGYEPSVGQFWDYAWLVLGPCTESLDVGNSIEAEARTISSRIGPKTYEARGMRLGQSKGERETKADAPFLLRRRHGNK